ncbi:MAG: anti-sigma factor, partial [Verrucomicrobia bacterium]|nr:anti-sigma factor [Verrucomicrobiota bacterium]
QSGTILIDGLNVPAQDRDYQLWVFVDGSPVSAGLLRVDTTGHVQGSYTIAQSINTVQRFAITDERKGGVPQPAGEIIMLSN